MDTTTVEQLAAYASAPLRLPVEGDDERERRHWAIRLVANLPADLDIGTLSTSLSQGATATLGEARKAYGLDPEGKEGLVEIGLHSIDERHLIMAITSVRLEQDIAHAWLVAPSTALRMLDDVLAIDDIQGIPRRYWRMMMGPPQMGR